MQVNHGETNRVDWRTVKKGGQNANNYVFNQKKEKICMNRTL